MRVACIVIPHLQAKAERILPDTDAPYDCRVFTWVVDGLTTISDRIEAAAPGTVYVRLDGLEKLYGGEAQLLKALLGAVPQGLEPRIGVADAKFPAFVAANVSSAGVTIVPASVPGFLAPCAVDWLPVPVEVREGPDRQPLAVYLRRQWCPVDRIDDRWSFDLWWLPEPLTRTYYRVNPGDGRQLTVFRNHRNSRWYRQGR